MTRPDWRLYAVAALVVIAASVGTALTNGNLLVVVGPLAALGAVWVLLKVSFEQLMLLFLGLLLLVDDTRSRPFMGQWESPLTRAGFFFYDTVEASMHIPGAKLFGLEVFLLVCGLIFAVNFSWGRRAPLQPASVTIKTALLGLLVIIAWEVWGLVRGGNVNFSLLQFRPMLFMCLTLILFSYAFWHPRSTRKLMTVILAVGVARALVGIVYWFLYLRGQSQLELGGGLYVTTHQDSLLWATGLIICATRMAHAPTRRSLWLLVTVGSILGYATVLNNRRLAFVTLALSAMVIFWLVQGRTKRRLQRLLVYCLPLLPVYVAVGWSSQAGWAKPIRVLKSVTDAKDVSSSMRDIENYNLVRTVKNNPVVGSGFGHPYEELVVAYDISKVLEAYLYLPHNSLLWLMSALGVVGFTLFWLLLLAGNYLAARVYYVTRRLDDKVLTMTAICVSVAYMVQAFGDLGVQSWMASLLIAACYGAVSARAVECAAWDNPTRVRALVPVETMRVGVGT